jgi:mRNA interferase MazF
LTAAYVPRRGDVVWLSLDPQSGHEQAGRRPVLVLSPENFNRRGMAWVAPITNTARGWPFEVPIPTGTGVTGVILADQTKSLDWRSRKADFEAALDEEVVNQVVALILPIIDPDEVFGSSDAAGG